MSIDADSAGTATARPLEPRASAAAPVHTPARDEGPAQPGAPARGPRVLVDGFFIDRPYGFGRYVRELVYAIDRHAPAIDLVVLVAPDGEAIARRLAARGRVVVAPERMFPRWEQMTVPAIARQVGADIVHFPYQTTAVRWPARASVMTLHDLLPHEPVPQGMKMVDRIAHLYRRWNWNRWGRRVARVLSVSPATEREARERFGVASAVTPNVIDAFVALNPPGVEAPHPRYFLHRGGDAPHKNTRRVLDAFGAVRSAHPDTELWIFGVGEDGGRFGAERHDGVRFLGRMDDATLADVYRGALALLMPSLHEGFGLPIIEAFGFGAPVITSSRPPMSEIACDGAGLLVDPESTDALRAAMLSLAGTPDVRTRLIEAGRRRLEAYSAKSVAQVLEATYVEVAAQLARR